MRKIASLGLSNCHKAEMIVVGADDFGHNDGTMHYECTKCHEACDLWQSPSKSMKQEERWEKELEKFWNTIANDETRAGIMNIEEMKAFIRTLLASERTALLGEIDKLFDDENLWEYLRNPMYVPMRIKFEELRQKVKKYA